MITVIGHLVLRPADSGEPDAVEGLAAEVAMAAAEAGASVQIVGKVGEDAAGDAVVLALGRARVGHAAVLRDAGHPTPILAAERADEEPGDAAVEEAVSLTEALLAPADARPEAPTAASGGDGILPADPSERPSLDAGDVELALRYLGDVAVVVLADPLEPDAAEAVAAGAAYAGAQVVGIVPTGGSLPPSLAAATVFEAPPSDPEHLFARLVAGYATALDGGQPAEQAFRGAVAGAGWEAATRA